MIYTDKYIYNYNYNYSQINTNLHIQIAEEHEERSSNPNTPRKQKDVEIRLADAGEACRSIDSVSECVDSFLCAYLQVESHRYVSQNGDAATIRDAAILLDSDASRNEMPISHHSIT